MNDIGVFAEQKTGKRVERMAIRAGLSTVAAAGGIIALAGGIVTPVGAAGLAVAAGAGAAGAAYGGFFAVKGLGKKIARAAGWMGNERRERATRLYQLAVDQKFPPAIRLLNALRVTVKMPLALLRANRAQGIEYIMQKLRS